MNLAAIKNNVNQQSLAYWLLALFPTMGAFTRHWFSTFFVLISLVGLYALVRRKADRSFPLYKEEKVVLIGMGLFFVAYLLPLFKWPMDISDLEVEVRYLLFIPVYLLVREMNASELWFFWGVIGGALCIFAYGMYELFVIRAGETVYNITGPYHHIYYGAMAAVTGFVALAAKENLAVKLRWFSVVAFVLALISAVLSGSRGSYVIVLVAALLWGALRLPRRRFILFTLMLGALMFALYKFSNTVNYQVGRAIDDVVYYFTQDDLSDIGGKRGGASARFDLWRFSIAIIRDHPFLGIGRSNFDQQKTHYMTPAQREDPLLQHSHPHNAYLGVLVSKGLVGAIAFALIFFYPAYIFFRDYRDSPATALPGIMLMVTYFAYSLVEVPFIKGNGTAVYLIFLAVILSSHLRRNQASFVQ
jgi:O-antigen ligase